MPTPTVIPAELSAVTSMTALDFLLSVLSSIIAGFLFWLLFSYVPAKDRYRKIRPRVEYDIYEISTMLFFHIQIIFQSNKHSGFSRQDWIKFGLLNKDDFDIWLQNKCLNESFQIDEMGKYLVPIGEDLADSSKKIIEKIDKSSTYFSFMKSKEILLLRKIRAKLEAYSFTDSADIMVGQYVVRPVILNMSYMANNFFELYKCFLELQTITWTYKRKNSPIDRRIVDSFNLDKATMYYYSDKLKRCHSFLKRNKTIEKTAWLSLLFRCEYKQEKKQKAYYSLRALLDSTSQKPIYLRSYFGDLYQMDDVRSILLDRYSEEELLAMEECLSREESIINDTLVKSEMIRRFYRKKTEEEERNGAKREQAAKKEREHMINQKGQSK